MKGFVRFITFLVFVGIILLAVLFAYNNTTEVGLWVGIDLPQQSVGVWLICAFILGGLLGLLTGMGIFRQLKYIMQIRHLRSQLEKVKNSGNGEQHPGRKG